MLMKKWVCIMFLLPLICMMTAGAANALWENEDQTFRLTGKFQTRETIRTNDSSGNTFPETEAGDLVQQRNLLYLEANHNLGNLGGFEVKYHLLGRLFYEGIYDYGPSAFQDVYDDNKHEFDRYHLRTDANIREGYVDVSKGPVFFRLGKQNLSWGETDVMRLLDNINPLDDSFGGIFEDLDDRRIPLEMARGSFNLGDVGPIKSFTLEGFWVPGSLDPTVAPVAPYGSPYALPAPTPSTNVEPKHDMDNSRYGGRIQGVVFEGLTFSLAHYKTFLDTPALTLHVFQQFDPLNPAAGFSIGPMLSHEKVSITGGSINYFESNLDMVIRSEVAMFWDEPVFIPEINTPDPTMALAVPGDPATAYPIFNEGKIPTKNILRYSLGLDKNVWIRALNPDSTFYVSFQYLGQYIHDYDDRMAVAVPSNAEPPYTYPTVERFDHTFTLLVKNSWLNGNLLPEMVLAYYARGAWLIQPSVEYQFDPFRIKLQYSNITGNLNGLGLFRDRDQVALTFTAVF